MDRSNKKDEMRAAGKKRLEEFRMKRQNKMGPVKAAEARNSGDDQTSASGPSLATGSDVLLHASEADSSNDELKVAASEAANGVAEQEKSASFQQEQAGSLSQSGSTNQEENGQSLASEMTNEMELVVEPAGVVMEQRDTDCGGRGQDLSGDTSVAGQLAAEMKAEYASELAELTHKLKLSYSEYEDMEARFKASMNEGDQLRQQLLESREHLKILEEGISQHDQELLDLEKRFQALLEENHHQKIEIGAAQQRFHRDEEIKQSLSSRLQQLKDELLVSRKGESMLAAQLDSAHTQLASMEKEKCQLSVDLEAASLLVRSAEQEKAEIGTALEKALQEQVKCVAEQELYMSQLNDHKATAFDLSKENGQLVDQVNTLKSEIYNLQRDRKVSDSGFQQQILKLAQDFDGVAQEAERLRSSLAATANEKSGLDSLLESVKKELVETLDVKHRLSDELLTAKEHLQAALEENKRFSAEVDVWQTSSKEHLNDNIQLRANVQDLRSELGSTRQKSADCDKELFACKQSLEELVKVRGQLENNLQILGIQTEECQREKIQLLFECDTLKADLRALSFEKSNLEGQVQAGKEQLAELLTETKKFEEKVLELNTKLELAVEDRKKIEEIHGCLLSEVELIRVNVKAATEERDDLRHKVEKVQQLNEELKEEACNLRIQLQAATTGWQDVMAAKSEQHVEVEQLKHTVQVVNEALQNHVQQIADLEQENLVLKTHISKAESTSLELEQAVRQVLPSESPEASLKFPGSGVHLASCVRKLIHEFEARAHHADHDVQNDSRHLVEHEGDVLGNRKEISSSDLEALSFHLKETREENSRLQVQLEERDTHALSRSQEVSSLTQQLFDLTEKCQAAAGKYEGQSDHSAVEMQLAESQKACAEQGDIIRSYLEMFEKVHGSLTTLNEKLRAELYNTSCVVSLQEPEVNTWSKVDALIDSCQDLFTRLSERDNGLRQQLKHLALKHQDLQDLADSLKDEVTTLLSERASAVKSSSEIQSELLELKSYVQRLELGDAENRALVRNHEKEQDACRQHIVSLLAIFDSSLQSSGSILDTPDLPEHELTDSISWLLNQLEERSKACLERATLQSQENLKAVAELQGKVEELQDLLAVARAEAERVGDDLNILSQKVDMPSVGTPDYRWDDFVASSFKSDAVGTLAVKIGRLVKVIHDDLQNRHTEIIQLKAEHEQFAKLVQTTSATNQKLSEQIHIVHENELEVQLKLEMSDSELQKVRHEYGRALETIQVLQNEIDVRKAKETELATKLEEALVRIGAVDEKHEMYQEENKKLQSDLAALQEAAACHEAVLKTVHSEVQIGVKAFVLRIVINLLAALSSSSDAAIEVVQGLVRNFSFSTTDYSKVSTQEIEKLREAVLESALEYNDTVKRNDRHHYDEQQKLDSTAKMLAKMEVALEAKTKKCSELVAHQNDEKKVLLQQIEALTNHVQELQSEISSLKSQQSQGEQKLQAAKEKLALAVSRGKALSQQRDALKQSLAGKSAELDLLVTTHSEQSKERDAALETSITNLTAAGRRADMAQQELEEVKGCLLELEQRLLAKATSCDTVMEKVPLSDVKTKELPTKVEWIVRSFDEIQQHSIAAVEELENIKKGAALLEHQLKDARDKEVVLIGELEAERCNSRQKASEVEKCMQMQALLSDEVSHNASAKDALEAELNLTAGKLAAEVASRLKLQSDFEGVVATALSVIPESMKTELWGPNGALPSSFNVVVSSLLALYNDSATEVGKLKEECEKLMVKLEQSNEVNNEWTCLKQQVKDLQQVVADKDLEISSLAARMEEAAATMAHQEEEIDGISQQMRKLKFSLDEAIREKTTLQTHLTDVEHRLSTTREKLGMAVRKGKALKLEHDALKHSLAESQEMAGTSVRELQLKESLLQELQNNLAEVLDEKQVLQKEKEAAVSQLVNETAGIKSVMEETASLRAYKLQKEYEVESLRETLSAHAAEFSKSQSAARHLSSEVSDLQVTNSDLRQELAAVHEEVVRLGQETGEVGSLKSCINIAVESMNCLVEELALMQANYGASIETGLEGQTRVSHRGNASLGVGQQSLMFTEDFIRQVCQHSVESARHFATLTQNIISRLKEQQLSKDREAMELTEEREHLQVAIQDIQTLSRKVIEEKENAITQMKRQLTQLESTVKDLRTNKDVDEAKMRALEASKAQHDHEIHSLQSKFHFTKQRADEEAKALRHAEAELVTLRELLSAKNEDLEAHMQVLCESETQVDALSQRVKELEATLRQKQVSLQSLEASRAKALSKLNTNYKKLNDVLQQSEELLALSENLQMDLERREAEILRLTEQLANAQSQVNTMQTSHQETHVNLDQLQSMLADLILKASKGAVSQFNVEKTEQVTGEHAMLSYVEELGSLLESLLSEIEVLKSTASKKDNQLQDMRIELQVLSAEKLALQGTVQSKQLQLQSLLAVAGSTSVAKIETSPVEIEDMGQRSARVVGVQMPSAAPHVRGPRKLPVSDVVLDVDLENQPLHDMEDKGHDYKSLAMAKFMPRVMRPAAERLDGFCVAGGRVLMKQPSVRFGLALKGIVRREVLADMQQVGTVPVSTVATVLASTKNGYIGRGLQDQ